MFQYFQVTPGSYSAVTVALPEVADQYPTMCEAFLTKLPLRVLGEIEIPSKIASQVRECSYRILPTHFPHRSLSSYLGLMLPLSDLIYWHLVRA